MSPAIISPNHTAVITGGASGIGRALAERCLANGMKVLVVDRNEEALKAEFGKPRQDAGVVLTHAADVASEGDWKKLKELVQKEMSGKVNLLVLNAGIMNPSTFQDPSSFRAVFDVNFFGVVNGLAALLSAVKLAGVESAESSQAPQAAVVITGSKQGITNPPGNPAYNASKAAVRTVAEQLHHDVSKPGTGVGVHLLVPGWTHTGMTGAGTRDKPAGAWLPSQVVDELLTAMEKQEFYVICPDNDVTREMDSKRVIWTAGDVAERRPPLSRWREEWKEKAQAWMDK